MEYLARKIARAKWMRKSDMEEAEIRADAITGCLRTSNDTLSTWECDITDESLADVVLALAAAGSTIDKMDIIVLRKDTLAELGIRLDATLGRTAARHLEALHVDLTGIELERLSKLARTIADQARGNINCYRFPRPRVISLLRSALSDGKLDLTILDTGIQDELARAS